MDRLARNRRPKTGDKTNCLPAGDGLPIWSTIPLDKKLPMMQNPKGSVVLCTTKLGQPKHRCKQEIDFDLRDPYGKYICSEYMPLHDPHLKSHFSSEMMRKHLIRKGFISEDGKVLCTLKEFNQYRRYLRHIFFLEIARDRKLQLLKYCKSDQQKEAELKANVSRGVLVRRRLQQILEHDMSKVNNTILFKAERLDKRLQEIKDEMVARERMCRAAADQRQMQVIKTQQETERRNQMMIKKWRHRERLRARLMDERENQRQLRAEMKCLTKWNVRKEAQRQMMDNDDEVCKLEEHARSKNIVKRDKIVTRQREVMDSKINDLKETTRLEKQRKDELYQARFKEKLASGDFRIWSKRKDRRRMNVPAFQSTWKLQDVLTKLTGSDLPPQDKGSKPRLMFRLNAAIDSAVDMATRTDDTEDADIKAKAHEVVQGVIQNVKNELFPAFMQLLDDEENDAVVVSRSVRFSGDEEEIPLKQLDSLDSTGSVHFRPVNEHVLTPVPSQLEIQQMEAEAILGSEIDCKGTSVSFVETLLLRLLDDLNSGRLSKDDILKLASYSMDIIQSTENELQKDALIAEVNEEMQSETDEPCLQSSSSSLIARQMVDFTLSRILDDIRAGNVITDDLLSLTVSVLDDSRAAAELGSDDMSSTDMDEFIDDTIRQATSEAYGSRDNSPICDALLDDFMINTLKNVITDLENELLDRSQLEALAVSVRDEAKGLMMGESDTDFTSTADVQGVLQNIIQNLQTGDIDLQGLYKIVFAIVSSYNMLKTPPTPCFEHKVTELMKDVLFTAEQKALLGEIENFDVEMVHKANQRLSATNLNVHQIEQLSSAIVGTVSKPSVVCKTSTSDIARAIVEDALRKAKEKLTSDTNDEQLVAGVQEVAAALISTLPEIEDKSPETAASPSLNEVFLNLLHQLKITVENTGEIEGVSSHDLEEIILFLTINVADDQLNEMATSVSRVVMSPMKSDSSFIADMAVKDIVKKVGSDLEYDKVEDGMIADMLNTISSSYRAAQAMESKPVALLNSLSSFLRDILGHVTYKIQTGEFNENDIHELSQILKDTIEDQQPERYPEIDGKPSGSHTAVEDKTPDELEATEEISQNEGEQIQPIVVPTAETLVVYLTKLMDEFESEGLDPKEAAELGNRLMECGKKIVASLSGKVSATASVANCVVEEVIKTLQREIDSGLLTNESLKEITKSIITSSSDSEMAEGLVNMTLRGIYRDVELGVVPIQISSIPTIDHTPSASTIADHVVMQTIDVITRDLTTKGLPSSMAVSIASSVILILSGELQPVLPAELEKFRKTITRITDCLSRDVLDPDDANKIFCLILENYQTYVLKSKTGQTMEETESLSDVDIALIDNLVSTTLKNIERSVARGQMSRKQFSIPSAISRSECNTSEYVEDLVECTLANIKADIYKVKPVQQYEDIVYFILDVVNKLQKELVDGTVSNLSIAHFFQAITDEPTDLRILEAEAKQNLEKVIADITEKKSSSKYVQNILNTYLSPDQQVSGVFSDPLKAVESILISVSSEILTKFVKATLQNILIEMREGNLSLSDKAPPGYVLRSASSIVAENVIHSVLSKIKNEMNNKISVKGGISKADFEKAASKIVLDVPASRDHHLSPSDDKQSGVSRHSRSSVMSKEVEDIILETLHNICSNLRLEQSMLPHKTHKGSKKAYSDDLSEHSQEIQDFVLDALQNIMTDLQDKRSLAELMIPKPDGNAGTGSGVDVPATSSRDAAVYVNTVLQDVLEDMKKELADKEASRIDESHDGTQIDMELMIVDALQHAVTDTEPLKSKHGLEPDQEEGVRNIVIESIRQTISNVREKKIKPDDLCVLYQALSKFTDSGEAGEELSVQADIDGTVTMLESVLMKIEAFGLDGQTLERIATQLATLGMESLGPCDVTSPNDMVSDVSVRSSAVSELVREVISKISRQLSSELLASVAKSDDKVQEQSEQSANGVAGAAGNKNNQNVDSAEKSDKVPAPSSSSSTAKDDAKNYNRRISASSGVTETVSAFSDLSNSNDGNVVGAMTKSIADHDNHSVTVERLERSFKYKPSPEAKLYKRKSEPNTITKRKTEIEESSEFNSPSNIKFEKGIATASSRVKLQNYPNIPSIVKKTNGQVSNPDNRHESIMRKYTVSSIPKPPRKDTPMPTKTSKRIPQLKTKAPVNISPAISSPQLGHTKKMAKPQSTPKHTREQQMVPKQQKKSATKSTWVTSPKVAITPVAPEKREDPFEVRSLCGIHKTRIRLVEPPVSHEETGADYSTSEDEYSYTSGLF